jgi:hypothetical protein
MLQARQKESSNKTNERRKEANKEEKGPLMNNFLDSRTKLTNQVNKEPK